MNKINEQKYLLKLRNSFNKLRKIREENNKKKVLRFSTRVNIISNK